VVFLVSLRVLGVKASEVSGAEAFRCLVARSAPRLVADHAGAARRVEVGLVAALVGFGGAQRRGRRRVLIYRFLTIVPTLVLGLLAARPGGGSSRFGRGQLAPRKGYELFLT